MYYATIFLCDQDRRVQLWYDTVTQSSSWTPTHVEYDEALTVRLYDTEPEQIQAALRRAHGHTLFLIMSAVRAQKYSYSLLQIEYVVSRVDRRPDMSDVEMMLEIVSVLDEAKSLGKWCLGPRQVKVVKRRGTPMHTRGEPSANGTTDRRKVVYYGDIRNPSA